MPWGRYVLGYHGCDIRVAKQVVAGTARLLPSENKYDWLGHGQYFWEDSVGRALRWASDEAQMHRRIERPAVLGAVIDLGECLNLTEAESINLVCDVHETLRQLMEERRKPMPKNTGTGLRARRLDCAVFETLHQSREDEGSHDSTPFALSSSKESRSTRRPAFANSTMSRSAYATRPTSSATSCRETSDPKARSSGSRCPQRESIPSRAERAIRRKRGMEMGAPRTRPVSR
jgi:hypothetical protein